MRLWRILAIATTVELAVGCALVGLAGLGGRWSGALDVANVAAPMTATGAAAALALALTVIPKGRLRIGTATLAGLGLLSAATRIAPDVVARFSPAETAGPVSMRVVTHNLWMDNIDPQRTVAVLAATGADAVLVQERQGRMQTAWRTLRGHYPHASACLGRATDLVVLSKRPLTATGCLGERGPREGGRSSVSAVWATTTDRAGRPVTLATTHFGWPVPPGRQARQLEQLAPFLARLDARTLILSGDFNTAPWTFAMERQDARLTPLRRATRALPTWPAAWPRLEARSLFPLIPIDHIYVGAGFQTAGVARGPRTGSDHYPVVADIKAAQ